MSIKVGGLTSTKLNYLLPPTQTNNILILQEVHAAGFETLKKRAIVSPAKGNWFLSKPPNKAESVMTFLTEELAKQVLEVEG
eukprot:snap_masked-scaffold_5-processed-gene-4.35-mRNA-1 protein AED:1.00 eAED:1.00 QI:0/-1/0/0/-1/1/1/0/81